LMDVGCPIKRQVPSFRARCIAWPRNDGEAIPRRSNPKFLMSRKRDSFSG
jgi:hypothetical protein